MQTRYFAAVVPLVLCSSVVRGAEPALRQAPEPEIADVVYALSGQSLIPLERQAPAFKASNRGFIVTSIRTAEEFPGPKSPVRFRHGETLSFVVRLIQPLGPIDPNTVYLVRRLTPRKDTREFLLSIGRTTPIGDSRTHIAATASLPVALTNFGDYSLRLDVSGLEPGEYAVGRPYFGQPVFCFGVD